MSLDKERPKYRILSPSGFFGPNDHLFEEGDEIVFDGTPNEEMEPLNEEAHKKLVAYISYLDDFARATADKLGRPFVERPKTLDGAYVLASELVRSDMQIMGNKNKEAGIEMVEREPTPETGNQNKRSRGRPRKDVSVL